MVSLLQARAHYSSTPSLHDHSLATFRPHERIFAFVRAAFCGCDFDSRESCFLITIHLWICANFSSTSLTRSLEKQPRSSSIFRTGVSLTMMNGEPVVPWPRDGTMRYLLWPPNASLRFCH